MSIELITPKVLEYIRQRCLGKSTYDLATEGIHTLNNETELVICYGDQSNNYCFDYYVNLDSHDVGYEGIITIESFELTRYTGTDEERDLHIDIPLRDLYNGLSEEDFFMQGTLVNFHDLTHEQILGVLAIREVLLSRIPNWSLKA